MSTYTLKNLGDVEDAAAKNNMGEGFSARFAREALDCEHTGFALQKLAADTATPFAHRHDEAEEVYVVIDGGGRMMLDDEFIDVGRYDAVRVSPGVARSFAAGPEGLEFLVFGPHHQGDGEILPYEWPEA